ncbi:glutamyl-tRNA synthetase [Stappia sp. 22II-S9-Z10]|nr:glutamyl-tRNA synthetase [Stappia sp. 22II-S9-Z10]
MPTTQEPGTQRPALLRSSRSVTRAGRSVDLRQRRAEPPVRLRPAEEAQDRRQLRPARLPRQRQTQRHEERLALRPRRRLHRAGPRLEGGLVPRLGRERIARGLKHRPVGRADRHRRRTVAQDRHPGQNVGAHGEIAAQRLPHRGIRHAASLRQPVGHRGEGHLVQQRRVQPLHVGRVEGGRAPGDRRKVRPGGERAKVRHRLHRVRRSGQNRQRGDRHRLDGGRAQTGQGQRIVALGERLPVCTGEEIVVAEGGRRTAQRLEQGKLHAGVGDVVLTAHDEGHAHVEIVHHRGEGVEVAAVRAHQNGVGDGVQVHPLLAPAAVVPGALPVRQAEAPVRAAPLGLESGAFGVGQRQARAVVDRRTAARPLQRAFALQLVRRLVAGVEEARRLQPRRRRVVKRDAVRLPLDPRRNDAQPCEVRRDRLRITLLGAFGVGVVVAKDEAAAGGEGDGVVVERGARVADVDLAGWGRGEADDLGHQGPGLVARVAWRADGGGPGAVGGASAS